MQSCEPNKDGPLREQFFSISLLEQVDEELCNNDKVSHKLAKRTSKTQEAVECFHSGIVGMVQHFHYSLSGTNERIFLYGHKIIVSNLFLYTLRPYANSILAK